MSERFSRVTVIRSVRQAVTYEVELSDDDLLELEGQCDILFDDDEQVCKSAIVQAAFEQGRVCRTDGWDADEGDVTVEVEDEATLIRAMRVWRELGR